MARFDIKTQGNYITITDTANPDPNDRLIKRMPKIDVRVANKYEGSTVYDVSFRNTGVFWLIAIEWSDFSVEGVDFTSQEDFETFIDNNTSGFNNGGGNGEGVTFAERTSFTSDLTLDNYYRIKEDISTSVTYEVDYTGQEDRILEIYLLPNILAGGSFQLGTSFPQNVRDAVGVITDLGETAIALVWDGNSFPFASKSSSVPVVTPNPPVITSVVVENNARNILKINLDTIVDGTDDTDLSLSFTVGTPKTISISTPIESGTIILKSTSFLSFISNSISKSHTSSNNLN